MTDPKTGTGKKPKGSNRRLYTDENPKDTIPIKMTTFQDVKNTIEKLEKLYKSGKRPHIRQHALAKRYTEFLKKRTKLKDESERKKLNFK